MTAAGPPGEPPTATGFPEAPDHPGEHYPYTFAHVTPTAWTQVCDRCGHRTRIDTAPRNRTRTRRRPAPPAPLPYRDYFTIGFQT
ncbi:hypothetical protein [Streptomonospora litoralis]|uniref:Uncharacterized protein n=1 Tax=Streptomonospora litoralis TaxID=2498135 RepID=A0A4P6Q536_9ACTN|nr:hypothetical protein [Streptomonospora litoralis]QBI52914.1 hypothetical protein EKD16_05555 [Streptomonospora litoralis]QBI55775.1 hypothetical protein EKD16_20060 [Streptomonospora litoralis]